MEWLSNLVRENMFRPEDIPKFQGKLFYEGKRQRPYLERFTVLLFLAAVIATMGVTADSTATVIGAMIIAPLMATGLRISAESTLTARTRQVVERLIQDTDFDLQAISVAGNQVSVLITAARRAAFHHRTNRQPERCYGTANWAGT